MTREIMPRDIVMVSGGFDPLLKHHIRHIKAAKELGDWLIVTITPDNSLIQKKGYYFINQEERMEIISSIKWVDNVVIAMDTDGTVVKTLERIRPRIFAKGGDRTPENMPQSEIDICKKIGCKIVYGVGGKKIGSSSEVVDRIYKILKEQGR